MEGGTIKTPDGTYKWVGARSSTVASDTEPKLIVIEPGLTVYLGGAGMTGGYIGSQVNALKRAGVLGAVNGRLSEGQMIDASLGVSKHRTRLKMMHGMTETGPYNYEADWSLSALGVDRELPRYGQFNLIGYSFGSLIAAQSALYYADKGTQVDYLVLIGSPISAEMLHEAQAHPRIKSVIVLNLEAYGDPLYAGMSLSEVLVNVATLVSQMDDSQAQGTGVGHFYYGIDGPEGDERRRALADSLYEKGLR
ncbi:alpha/beta hydrolase [Pseudomonas capsici]|uniref:alpha/beta hydrolase n=1 Tax=Pseudomonas capsici TaxID=2810614 RepID=UPI0021F1D551|nr:alpha/beta hydrolase [Pseudomonas capsici]MCV4285712.1 alpha/beta hydrolase [Pseudomonas capsici]